MPEFEYFEREFKCRGVIIRLENGLACVHKINGLITDLYWVPEKNFKLGDIVNVFKTETSTGIWYIGERENV